MADQNYLIPIGVKPDTGPGIATIKRDFASLRTDIAKPLRTGFSIDYKPLDELDRRLAKTRQNASSIGGGQITVPRTSLAEIPLAKAKTGRVTSDEQKIEDIMAGIIAGMEQREEIERELAKVAKLELEARKRAGLSNSGYIDVRKEDIELGAVNRVRRAPRRDRMSLREQEENNRTGNVVPLTDGYGSLSAKTQQMLAGDRRRQLRDLNSTGRRAAGASGGDMIGPLKLEDKVGLGGGAKLTGSAGLIAGGVAVGVAAFGELGNQLKAYRDKLAQGASGRDAFLTGLREFGAKLPIIGGVIDGLDNLAAELSGEGDKIRARAKGDQKAGDIAAINARSQAIAAAGKAAVDPLVDAAYTATGDSRIADANRFDPTGRAGARAGLEVGRDALFRDLAKQEADLRERASSRTSADQRINQGALDTGLAAINKQRTEALAKFDADMAQQRITAAKEEVEQRKQVEADVFQTRQQYLTKEGDVVRANLEAVDREAEQAIQAARERYDATVTSFGANSNQAKDAGDTLNKSLKSIEDRKNVNRASIIEQAGRAAMGTIAGELQVRAALGDYKAAIQASALVIDQQTKARRDELTAIVNNTNLTDQARKTAQEQLNGLNGVIQQQKATAKAEIESQESQRRAGVFADINSGRIDELRRRAERTGNRGFGLQADAYDLAQQFEQRRLALEDRIARGGLQADERQGIESEIAALPDRLKAAVGDLTRAKVSASDFMSAATTAAQDAGGLTGFAQNARENVQSRIAKLNEDMAKTLQKILEAITKGNGNNVIRLPAF